MKQLKVGSDFSGVGAFDQALKSLNVNFTKEYACDVCKWARLTYLHNYGTAEDINIYNSEDCQRINNAYHMAFVDKKANKVKEEEWKFVEENEERVARSFSFYYPWNVYKRTIPQEPVDIYMTSPPCFTGDTLIKTNIGYKEIKDIQIGDLVLTHENRYQKVIDFGSKKSEIYELKAQGILATKTTANHRYYVRKIVDNKLSEPQWIEIKDLTSEYYISVNIEQTIQDVINPDYSNFDHISILHRKRYQTLGFGIKSIKYLEHKKLYDIIWETENDKKSIRISDKIWYPIHSIEKLDYEDIVFDITVENDHSFTANQAIVHNCQSFSLAGKRLGKNDPRGILFFNSLEFIEKNKPKCFIFENVKGLLSDDDGHTFKEWIHYLGGKSVNGHPILNFGNSVPYHVYYKVLNAKEHGVPQNRERIFIIGFRDEEDKYFNWPDTEPLKKTLMDVLEQNVDEKYYLSDTMVKRLKIKQKDGRAVPFYQGEDKAANCLVATYYKTPTDGQYVDQDKINVIGELDRPDHHEQANRIYDSNGLSPTLNARTDSPMIMEIGALRGRNLEDINDRTSGIDTEQILEMNNFGISNTLTTVQKDNVVVETKVIKNQRSEDGKLNRRTNKSELGIDTGSFKDQELVVTDQEFSYTILANPNHTKEGLLLETKVIVHKRPDGEKEREIILSNQDYVPTIVAQPAYCEGLVAEKYEGNNNIHHRIRKLTPRECFRLMDFPEDFDFSVVANSHAYKQAGNSIVRRVLAKMIDNFSFINQYKNQ